MGTTIIGERVPLVITDEMEQAGRKFALAIAKRNPDELWLLAQEWGERLEAVVVDPMKLAVAELETLPLRIINQLEDWQVLWVFELVEMDEVDILAMPNVARKVIADVVLALDTVGVPSDKQGAWPKLLAKPKSFWWQTVEERQEGVKQ